MPASRTLALVAVFLAAGCGASNNKSRIEGRWTFDTDDAAFRDAALVFGDDGVVVLERPVLRPTSFGQFKPVARTAWRYKLLAGDAADFYDLPPDANERLGLFPTPNGLVRTTIRIETTTDAKYEGREMTLTDASGRTLKLTAVR